MSHCARTPISTRETGRVDTTTIRPTRLLAMTFLALGLSGCAGGAIYDPFRATPALTAEGPLKADSNAAMPSLIRRFSKDYGAAEAEPDDDLLAVAMYRSGVALVSENCSDLFTYLGKARQNLSAGQKATGIAGGLAASIMAVTGVAAKPIGLVGTSVAALLAGSEVYGETYLFSPDTAAVQKLVVQAQRVYLEAAEPQVQAWRLKHVGAFAEAHSLIRDYQQICEVQSIRAVVNDAILNSKLTADGQQFRDAFTRENDAQLQFAIANTLGLAPGTLGDTGLAGLYWALSNRPVALDQAELASKFLTGSLIPLKERLQRRDATAANRDTWNRVAALFSRLSSAERARLEGIVQTRLAGNMPPAGAPSAPALLSTKRIQVHTVPNPDR